MYNIQKIFQKQVFVIILTFLLTAFTHASDTDFSIDNNVDITPHPLKTVRILSLDGGGVRGISEARFVEHLESSLGMPISSAFHLIGGTSAGGILSIFLTTPKEPGSTQPKYSAEELVEILQKRSTDMFVQRYLSFWGLFGPKYRIDSFCSVLSEYLGDDKLNNSIIPTAVVTYDIVRQKLKTIASSDKKEIFTKVTAISATAAAESYFEPCHATPINNPRRSYDLADGGTGANNPTLCLLSKAIKLYPDADSFEIISVGSGQANKPLPDMKNAGLFRWAPHLTRMFMAGETSKDDTFLNTAFYQHTNTNGVLRGHYSRWSPMLNHENTQLDNTDPANLRAIITATDNHILARQTEYNDLVDRLRLPKAIF